jgi:putative FmdB family regulatory protein
MGEGRFQIREALTATSHGRNGGVGDRLSVLSEVNMPRYEFYCEDCKKPFGLILTLAEYEKGKVKCPKCGKEHVHQEAAAFFAVTSKKS